MISLEIIWPSKQGFFWQIPIHGDIWDDEETWCAVCNRNRSKKFFYTYSGPSRLPLLQLRVNKFCAIPWTVKHGIIGDKLPSPFPHVQPRWDRRRVCVLWTLWINSNCEALFPGGHLLDPCFHFDFRQFGLLWGNTYLKKQESCLRLLTADDQSTTSPSAPVYRLWLLRVPLLSVHLYSAMILY